MKIVIFFLILLFTPAIVHGQFVPTNCNGTNDTAKFTTIVSLAGSNTATLEVPFINGSRCAVNTMTLPANITIDNTVGTGIKVNSGQTLTVLGPIVNPTGKPLFFGPGTVSFVGNTFIGSSGQSLVSNGLGGTSWQTISGGGGGGAGVSSFEGRDGPVVSAFGDYTWAEINKSSSSLEDLTIRSAAELSNGTTGTGPVVLSDSPTLITPVLGAATATSINRLTLTAPATNATLTIADGKTLTVNNSLALAGTDSEALTLTGSLTVAADTTINGGGTLALGGFTGTLPTTGTFALGANTLSVSTSNNTSTSSHTHAITSSSNPGTTAALLATDSSGFLRLTRLGIGAAPTQPLEVNGNVLISASTANLFLKDTSTGWQSATTTVVTPLNNNSIRSTDFTDDLVGWNISAVGNAQFNNVDVRGAIRASVIVHQALQATAGTFGVFKSAGKLLNDVVIPSGPTYGTTTVNIDIEDSSLGHVQLFVTNDILRLKDGFVGDTWLSVSTVVDMGSFWRYVSTIMAGTNNVTFRAGLGVADYGGNGQGFIIQTADQTNAPYLQMATHAATFTSLDPTGTLIITPRSRTGNLNGTYGYATDIYGFAAGQYGTSGQSWVTVDQTNGIRMGSNTTPRMHIHPDGSGFLANSSISWNAAGVLTIVNNASIAGWIINSTSLSNGVTFIASAQDVPASGAYAWFGKAAAGYQGVWLKDSSNRYMAMLTEGGVGPRLVLNDATRNRVAIGDLNTPWGLEGAVNSVGLKIWDSAGALLVQFHNLANTIANWTITTNRISAGSGSTTVGMDATVTGGDDVRFFAGSATPSSAPFRVTEAGALVATNATITGAVTATSGSFTGAITATSGTFAGSLSASTGTFAGDLTGTSMSLTGKLTMSGASSAIAIGATPPTNASTGTGLWVDRTGLYGLNSNVRQVVINATTGKLRAGADIVQLGSNGIEIAAVGDGAGREYKFVDNLDGFYLGGMMGIFNAGSPANFTLVLEAMVPDDNSAVRIEARGITSSIQLKTTTGGGTNRDDVRVDGGIVVGAAGSVPIAHGAGTITVLTDIYKQGTAYTNPDFVFERWATGQIVKFADKPGALAYRGPMSFPELRSFLSTNFHLPGFGQQAGHGLFSGGDALLKALEESYTYILELEERVRKLESLEERIKRLESKQ